MKTCKMGCGKMKAGGPVKKVKKMALGGSATNKLNNPRPATKPQRGGSNVKMGIYGVPNAGPTGPNIQGVNTMKKGGVVRKLAKAQKGISVKEGSKDPVRNENTKDAAIGSAAYNKQFTSKAARDSANYYRNYAKSLAKYDSKNSNAITKNLDNLQRQYDKGKPGYDAMGYKKDSEGRSSSSKWYGFDPKTKKYTMGPNKGKTHGQVMKATKKK